MNPWNIRIFYYTFTLTDRVPVAVSVTNKEKKCMKRKKKKEIRMLNIYLKRFKI